MDMNTAILLRHVERLMAVLIGGLSILPGYHGFQRVPERHEGEGPRSHISDNCNVRRPSLPERGLLCRPGESPR